MSGSDVEVYVYNGCRIYYGYSQNRSTATKTRTETQEARDKRKTEAKAKAARRARETFRRLYNANAWQWENPRGEKCQPIMVTLTFKEEVRDANEAKKLFAEFILRLNYQRMKCGSKEKVKYIAVPELHKENRPQVVHFHVIFFNIGFIPKEELAELWNRGLVHVQRISDKDAFRSLVPTYFAKEFETTSRARMKRYLTSRGLKKPAVVLDERTVDDILAGLTKAELEEEREINTDSFGVITYKRYRNEVENNY